MESSKTDWRELCVAATKERDPEKLFSLVDQILQALDTQEHSFATSHRQDLSRGPS